METHEQEARLIELGCTLLQGYRLAEPMTGPELEARLEAAAKR